MSAALLVADSGPLIALARLDLLALPRRIFARVLVISTVWDEVTRAPRPAEMAPLLSCLRNDGIEVVPAPANPSGLANDARLNEGELSAIALALAMQATVLIDERLARASAQALGLPVIGTLGLLVRARQDGLIGKLAPVLDTLVDSGYFLAPSLVAQVLDAVGETGRDSS